MPIYTVELDGKQYDIEGDRPPNEAEARAAIGAFASSPQTPATPPPAAATAGMIDQSTMQGDPKRPDTFFGREVRPDVSDAVDGKEVLQGVPMLWSPGAPTAALAAAKKVPGIMARGLGISKARAGANIQGAVEAAKGVAVNAEAPGEVGLGILESKGIETIPRVVESFMRRITDPAKGELAVEEARRYYSAMSRLSTNDFNRLTPAMQRQVGAMSRALGDALTGAMDTVGKGAQYTSGMKEYARASTAAKVGKRVGQAAGAGLTLEVLMHRLKDAAKQQFPTP